MRRAPLLHHLHRAIRQPTLAARSPPPYRLASLLLELTTSLPAVTLTCLAVQSSAGPGCTLWLFARDTVRPCSAHRDRPGKHDNIADTAQLTPPPPLRRCPLTRPASLREADCHPSGTLSHGSGDRENGVASAISEVFRRN